MSIDTYLRNDLLRCTQRDIEFYNDATRGLPARHGDPQPVYSSGPHCVQCFIHALQLTDLDNESNEERMRVLEIGFNRGYSAALWLALGCKVTSLDVIHGAVQEQAYNALSTRDPDFRFYDRTTIVSWHDARYDLIYIDGAHDEHSVAADIALARTLAVPWLLFDDWYPHWGPGVQPAIAAAQLHVVALLGGMALCQWSNGYVTEGT